MRRLMRILLLAKPWKLFKCGMAWSVRCLPTHQRYAFMNVALHWWVLSSSRKYSLVRSLFSFINFIIIIFFGKDVSCNVLVGNKSF